MTSPLHLSSENPDWQTPQWFLDIVRQIGPIALDPCGAPGNPTRAARQILQSDTTCGLRDSWERPEGSLAFINPRYGPYLSGSIEHSYAHTRKCRRCEDGLWYDGFDCNIAECCPYCGGKGRRTTGRGRGWAARIAEDSGKWLTLVPASTGTAWWRTLWHASDLCVFWNKRIPFVHPDTGVAKKGTTFDSCVFYHGAWGGRAVRVLGEHGTVAPTG